MWIIFESVTHQKEGLYELKIVVYENMEKIGCVSNWSEERQRIDENDEWQTIRAEA